MKGGALINGRRRACLFVKSMSSTILCRGTHNYISNALLHSPLQSKMQRLLSNEIQYQCEYAPPHEPLTEYDRFSVEDRPGDQSVRLIGKSTEDENIKIDATMFDGFVVEQIEDDRGTREKPRFHISMLVDIWKGEKSDAMKFVCSAWPDSLEIQKIFAYKHVESGAPFYPGPHFRNLKKSLQMGFYEFLRTRGVDDKVSVFLHKYMANKDRLELIRWLGKVDRYMKM